MDADVDLYQARSFQTGRTRTSARTTLQAVEGRKQGPGRTQHLAAPQSHGRLLAPPPRLTRGWESLCSAFPVGRGGGGWRLGIATYTPSTLRPLKPHTGRLV